MTPEPKPPTDAGDRPGIYAWIVVGLLFVTAALNYLDRLMITSMRDPIRAQIPMSDAQFGLLTSAFLAVYAIVSPLGGYLADRVGRRRVIVSSLAIWSAATACTAFAHTFHQLLSARALMGVSEACYVPAALAMVSDYHRGRTRSLATGIHMVGIYLGAALGGIGGVFADHFGWQSGFKVFGTIGILYGVVLLMTLRDAPAIVVETTIDRPKLSAAMDALFRRAGFYVLLFINILTGVVNWAIYGWMPTFLKQQFHMTNGAAGLSGTAYIQVASFVGVLLAGVLADRWSRRIAGARALVPGIGYIAASPFLFLAASTGTLPIAIAGLVVFGLARGAVDANQMPLLRELVPEIYSATGYGFLNFVSTGAGGLMVYASGALLDARIPLSLTFKACGGALLLAGAAFVSLKFISATRPVGDGIGMESSGR